MLVNKSIVSSARGPPSGVLPFWGHTDGMSTESGPHLHTLMASYGVGGSFVDWVLEGNLAGFWGEFLRSGRPRGPGQVFKHVLGLRPVGPHSNFYGLLPPSPELGCSKCARPPPPVTLMIPEMFGGQFYSEQVRNVSQTDTLVVLCSDPQQAFRDVLLHSHPLQIMAAMKKAMKAAMKATHKECLTISTGSSGFVFGPCSIAQSILFGSSFFLVWVVVGPRGFREGPGSRRNPDGWPWGASRGPRSPRVPGHKYKNPYLLWGPFKRPSLGAGGRGFVFGPLVWQKTYRCPALQGGRPLSAELVDLATIASLQGHEEGHEEGGRPCRGGAPCQEGDEEGNEGQEVSEVAYLFCRRGLGLRRRNVFSSFF